VLALCFYDYVLIVVQDVLFFSVLDLFYCVSLCCRIGVINDDDDDVDDDLLYYGSLSTDCSECFGVFSALDLSVGLLKFGVIRPAVRTDDRSSRRQSVCYLIFRLSTCPAHVRFLRSFISAGGS